MSYKSFFTRNFSINTGRLLLVMLASLLLAGCSNDMTELETKVESLISKQDSNVPPPPKYTEFPKFTYVAQKLRDPFAPPRNHLPIGTGKKSASCKGPKISSARRKQPLEAYSLDSLRMVGTLNRKGVLWALLRTKDGTIHRVRHNYYIGQNHGRITGISDGKISVREIITNRDNKFNDGCPYRYRSASIALSR